MPGPDGSIYIANGYGDSRIFRFDKNGNYATSPKFDPNNVTQWGMNWGNNATDSPLPSSDLWQMVVWGQGGPWFSDDLTEKKN